MLKIIFWDVQHGSAAYIRTPNGKHIVIDLGTGTLSDSGREFSPLLYLKNKLKIDQLDAVVITHPHKDHLDDIFNFDELNPRVLTRPKRISKELILEGNREEDSEFIEKYLEISARYDSAVSEADSPYNSENNGGVEIIKYFSSKDDHSNLNDYSYVVLIEYAGSKILIPGDNESASWKVLLERADFRNAIKKTDILVAAHHGRESGFYPDLFQYISPRLVIISDGRFTETSATSRYSEKARGWKVHLKDGSDEKEKYCVSTRDNGNISVKFGFNDEANQKDPFIDVRVDKF